MSAPNLDGKTITLKANEARAFAVTGNFFFCSQASVPFVLSIDGGAEIPIVQGINFGTGGAFKNLIFRDISGAGVTITFYSGAGAIGYGSPIVNTIITNAPTYTKGYGVIGLAAGGNQVFAGLDGVKVRKQIIVTNDDANNVLNIVDANGNIAARVYPQRAWTAESSGYFKIVNGNGVALNAYVLEIFYL